MTDENNSKNEMGNVDDMDTEELNEEREEIVSEIKKRLSEREERIEELEQEIDNKEERIEELEELSQRLKADFDNYRKKSKDRKERARQRGKEEFVHALIKPIDDLRKALDMESKILDEESESDSILTGLYEGVKSIYDDFLNALSKHNFELIIPEENDEFDHDRHEAVGVVEGENDNCIAEVLQIGYSFEERVIQPAKVIVYSDDENNSKEDNED